jgi:shikimate 5-dehydrogenase
MPYKALAYGVADRLSERAQQVGAVNTLSLAGAELCGDNTDVAGVDYAFEAAGLSRDDAVIVLGAGGASAAAQVALAGRELHVVARNPEAAAALVARIGSTASVIPWGDPIPPGVLVNATSLGMGGEILPDYMLGAATGLLDMAYADTPTRSVITMQDRGVPVADGLDMLVGQAIGCFEIWSGREVPALVFRRAAEAELESRAGGTAF